MEEKGRENANRKGKSIVVNMSVWFKRMQARIHIYVGRMVTWKNQKGEEDEIWKHTPQGL